MDLALWSTKLQVMCISTCPLVHVPQYLCSTNWTQSIILKNKARLRSWEKWWQSERQIAKELRWICLQHIVYFLKMYFITNYILFSFRKNRLIYFYVWVFTWMYLSAPCVPGANRSHNRMLDLLELELQLVGRCWVQNQVL